MRYVIRRPGMCLGVGLRDGFTLEVTDAAARKMTRKEYYAARSWLRHCARSIRQERDKVALYGASPAMQAMADVKKLEKLREEYPEEFAEALRWHAAQHWFD